MLLLSVVMVIGSGFRKLMGMGRAKGFSGVS